MMGKVRWSELWKKYKFVLLVVLVGVVLMLLPVSSKTKEPAAETRTSEESFDLEAEERRMEELLGRIDGVGKLRLMLTLQSGTRLTLADLTLDTRTHQVTRGGQEIALTPKEFSVLDYLLRNQGTVLSREQILEHAWDFSYEGYSNMVDVYIKTLRKKIDKDFEPKLLHTVRGTGYVLKV